MLFTTAYGAAADSALLGAVERAQERMHRLITSARRGVARDEALDQNRCERDWLKAHGSQLIS
jgi:hypothetical protein